MIKVLIKIFISLQDAESSVPDGRVGGWVAGWLDQLEIRLNSASVEVEVTDEVEVETELGNIVSEKNGLKN